ncbi:MAG: PEP-CTERM sorting domain-containing protein [Planctomycetota bacterium]
MGTFSRQFLTAATAMAALLATLGQCHAQQIDLSLNLYYADPTDANSGGTWEVVALSDGFGIDLVSFALTGTDGNATSALPTGAIAAGSGAATAGFQVFSAVSDGSVLRVTGAQAQGGIEGDEAGAFYGVGTLDNGSPAFADQEPGVMTLGPTFTTLTNPVNTPWSVGDDPLGNPLFNSAASIATGSFDPMETPAFDTTNPELTLGAVFPSVGTSNAVPLSDAATITMTVRRNLTVTTTPDYNANGFVDAADYTIWRDTLGQQVLAGTGADGSGNGVIDAADYTLWRANFGNPSSPATLTLTAVVPEPGTAALLGLLGGVLGLVRTRKPGVFDRAVRMPEKLEYEEKLLDTPETPSHNASK